MLKPESLNEPYVACNHILYFRTDEGKEGKARIMFEMSGKASLHDYKVREAAAQFYAEELAKRDDLTDVFLVVLNQNGTERFGWAKKGRGRINTW